MFFFRFPSFGTCFHHPSHARGVTVFLYSSLLLFLWFRWFLFLFLDQLRHFGIRCYGLNHDNVTGVHVHTVRPVPFLAPF
jgi:hypothetical protein